MVPAESPSSKANPFNISNGEHISLNPDSSGKDQLSSEEMEKRRLQFKMRLDSI